MPSPFPGMNPYLESPDVWSSFHNTFMVEVSRRLNQLLPAPFVSLVEQRCYVTQESDGGRLSDIVPDGIVIADRNQYRVAVNTPSADRATMSGTTGDRRVATVATLTITPPTAIAVAYTLEHREIFLNISNGRDRNNVLTTIELLSPANKARGVGRDAYLKKQSEILDSNTHLVEIDLLRGGTHTVAALEEVLRLQGSYAYCVSLSLARERDRFPFWLCQLPTPLPTIPIPINNEMGDIALDLQATLHQCYDDHRFEGIVRYDQPCDPPLSPDDAAWAESILSEKGLR